MSGRTAGIRLGYTGAEAKEQGEQLLNNFFAGFPGVKTAIDQSKEFLKKNGYVEDFLGRRRRLSDINLPAYEVYLKNQSANSTFNPFLICANKVVIDPKILKWQAKISETIEKNNAFRKKKDPSFVPSDELSNKAYETICKEALADGVVIKANTARRAQAERQCFNARIQGSAASLTKLAMIDIANDRELQELDAHLIITVHDEVLVECPEYYANRVEVRLPEIMVAAAAKVGDEVPQSCDPYNVSRWYADTMAATLLDECSKLEAKGYSRDDAFSEVIKNHSELPEASILDVLTGKTEEILY